MRVQRPYIDDDCTRDEKERCPGCVGERRDEYVSGLEPGHVGRVMEHADPPGVASGAATDASDHAALGNRGNPSGRTSLPLRERERVGGDDERRVELEELLVLAEARDDEIAERRRILDV